MEIPQMLRELLNINPSFPQNEGKFVWDLLLPQSYLLKKLLKTLRFRKVLKHLEPTLSQIEEYAGSSSKEAASNNNSKAFSLIQIVIRAKSGSFKGFYMLLPSFNENDDKNGPKQNNINRLIGKMKMIKNVQSFTHRTAAMAHKNVFYNNFFFNKKIHF